MPRHADGRITIRTIADKIEFGYEMSVYCHGQRDGRWCHHSARIDLVALAERLGPDHSTLAKDLKPYFRCSKCGSKDIGFGVHPPAPVAPTRLAHTAPRDPSLPDEKSYREQKRPRRRGTKNDKPPDSRNGRL